MKSHGTFNITHHESLKHAIYEGNFYEKFLLQSSRFGDANRLVYDIDELQNIRIISCRGHYED